MRPPRALTIAGSDSGGGAGIQADLKTFTAYGVYGMSALTAVTAQSTRGVFDVHLLPPRLVGRQIDVVLDDLGADAIKIGMLGSAEIVREVAERLRAQAVRQVVVDPVMRAKGGDALLDPGAEAALREELLSLAQVVTPNLPEAEALTGRTIRTLQDMRDAARRLHALGPAWVVVKGGHLEEGEATDVVYDGQNFTELSAPRLATRNTHGTGCTFSAAIAAGLALGWDPAKAIAEAKDFIQRAITGAMAWQLGSGHGPTNHLIGRHKA